MREDELIDLVRRHKVIYNNKSADYRDAAKRHEAWVEIANQYGSTVEDCKEAWSKLRNCFTNAIKRRTKKKNLLEPWRFEKQMAFLRPYLKGCHERNGNTYIKDDPEAVTFYEDSWDSNTTPKRGQSTERIREPSLSSVSYKRASTDNSLFGMMDADDNSHHIRQNSQDLDDIDHFFLSMSKMAKRLPRTDQLRITLDLHKAISEAELKQLQQAQDQPESSTKSK